MAAYQAAVIPFNYKGITVVRPERFELPTAGFEDQNSIQLSYGRNIWYSWVDSNHRRSLIWGHMPGINRVFYR